ncbi:hypothetical protein J4208_00575 [Candidatus Woesearchaeota archaeon]|nr:hypothetical protein [Candidatus Woesearchaeota archaeon]
MKKVLGVDVGGVIIASRQGDRDTFFNGNHLEAAASPYVFEGLRKLVDEVFGEEHAHIVSMCGPRTQQKTREWLEYHNFFEKTNMRRGNVHFCLERKDKADICRAYGITTFIDDKLEVHRYLYEAGIPDLYLFNPDPIEVEQFQPYLQHVQQVNDWQEVVEKIIKSTK